MVVQNNIPALNSHRNLQINNSSLAKNLERLSSGFRINRAADDAAGLAISERMRGQIRGLGMAEQNTSQGINLIQTAEGGLQETQNILQRIRELAVMSSNATFGDGDRQQIHHEVVALIDEMDRIASSTHYNGINLIDGSFGSKRVGSENTNVLGLNLDTLRLLDGALRGVTDLNARITVTEMNGIDPTTGAATSKNVIALQIGDITYVGEQTLPIVDLDSVRITDSRNPNATDIGDQDAANLIAQWANKTLGTNLADGIRGLANNAVVAFAATGSMAPAAALQNIMNDISDILGLTGTDRLVASGATWTDGDRDAIRAALAEYSLNNALTEDQALALRDRINGVAGIPAANAFTFTINATDGQITWAGGPAGADSADVIAARQLAQLQAAVEAEFGADWNRDPATGALMPITTTAEIATALQTLAQAQFASEAEQNAFMDRVRSIDGLDAATNVNGTFVVDNQVQADAINNVLNAIRNFDGQLRASDMEELAAILRANSVFELSFEEITDGVGVQFRDNAGNVVADVEFTSTASDLRNGVISSVVLIDNNFAVGNARVAERDAVSSALIFQIGANGGQDQKASLAVRNMNAGSLGFVDERGTSWAIRQMADSIINGRAVDEENHGISILTRNGANAAINVIDAALDQVSSQRAQLGAMQNRLESTMNSLGVAKENLTAAESTIRDVDMAAEMMAFTQNNILTQAAQAMLAQANQLPQGVLQLLR